MKTFITTALVLSMAAATSFAQTKSSTVPAAKQAPAVATPPPAVNTPPPAVNTPPPIPNTPPPAGATPPPGGNTAPPAGATPPPAVNTTPGSAIRPGNNQLVQPGLNQNNNNIQPGVQPGVNSPGSGQGQMPTNSAFNANGFNGGFGTGRNNLSNTTNNGNTTPGQLYPPNSPVQPRTVQPSVIQH